MTGNKGMENMIQSINLLQDKLNPLGINLALDLPQIAVVGGQSAGKSSVLESFVGKEFLPRGSGIVTRRPIILQLISNDGLYGEFLHLPDRRFSNFDDIRREIVAETDRETLGNKGISSKPINLKIYSPDVVDITLIDLPGLTKVPVGNQPQDIEIQIRKMILSYITRENCLILAVTAANQDLATSDALQLAKEADPEGERTIGVLTKMDLMDDGTDARDILDGKLLPLKRGYIGVINRSQKDIDSKKSITEALTSESKYFSDHSEYWDISDRLGTSYLQKFLNKELSTHIFKQLPSLRDMFQSKSNGLEDKLETLDVPEQNPDHEKTLSELNEQLRRDFELSIGRSASVKVDVEKLSGGTRINSLMNERYPKEITAMFYDENKLRLEIAFSIQNIHGAHLGMFTPDMAFEAVIRNQIEQFREPSLRCIDWVTRELENVIKDCVRNIERYPRVREAFSTLTLKFIRECQKECKSRMQYMVAVQLSYMNTIHEDFVGIKSDEQMLPSYDNPKSQFEVSAALNNKHISNRGWISHRKNDFWFVLQNYTLSWYKDEEEKDKRGSMSLNEFQVKTGKDNKTLILIILNKRNVFSKDNKQMELILNSSLEVEKWRESLVDSGVNCIDSDSNFYAIDNDSDTNSVSNSPLTNRQPNGEIPQKHPERPTKPSAEELALPNHLRPQVDVVKKLVDSYVKILKKTFKDYMPKLIILALIDATKTFIAVDLRLRVRELISSVEDIMGGDPDEEMRKDLINELNSYEEAIVIIDEVMLQN